MSHQRVVIGYETLDDIRSHGVAEYPDEACGGLLGGSGDAAVIRVAEAVPLANAREDERERRYLIGPDDVLSLEKRAEASGLRVIGFYHSHPDDDAAPSEFDREHAWPGYAYLIVSVEDAQASDVQAWQLADDRSRFISLALVPKEGVARRDTET
ncbi:MAG: M67 family metallopeptidase [Gemmatimonadetes bacterium]|uniref:M67 family metallopeptidase n=1 Tax=Candidatus Kutchimonas denitrificans TaxID=3056748 RepID=A0AAE4Z6L7_9BACT|nr:M67 family metallopeptidase [Gemmatimonadota bacterium]NIR74709.1 M67 family metallopeptidase [Candidatus Kutchimonas denitrificans]NIS01459.1 M67 family metallopeptidase [Gemmatimonadota bacterium]NIT67200.1 M67 family metallopeptidase [Gemmatimonadota bacterium]NIU52374.1 hypothetical protein [Gemmatimonadota bacterium]